MRLVIFNVLIVLILLVNSLCLGAQGPEDWEIALEKGETTKAHSLVNEKIAKIFKNFGENNKYGKMVAFGEYRVCCNKIKDVHKYDFGIMISEDAISKLPFAKSFFLSQRAWFLVGKNEFAKALLDYEEAIKILSPSTKSVVKSNYQAELAFFLATCPGDDYRDGKKALELAEQATNKNRNDNTLTAMAAAYAELGRFQEAVKLQEEAIDYKRSDQYGIAVKEWYLNAYEKYLNSYKTGKPWRMETEKTAN